MTSPNLTLYHFPGACSQVSLVALEQASLVYRLELVNLATGQQTTSEYASVSPLGKVPTLVIDGQPLSENAAILVYVAAIRPEAGLFPASSDPLVLAEAQAGLSFCGGTLHPNVRGVVNPGRMTSGEVEGVRARSSELLSKAFGYAERRLSVTGWWQAERSIVDVYLNWAFTTAIRGPFDPSPFPTLSGLHTRLMECPAFARTMERENAARIQLGL